MQLIKTTNVKYKFYLGIGIPWTLCHLAVSYLWICLRQRIETVAYKALPRTLARDETKDQIQVIEYSFST